MQAIKISKQTARRYILGRQGVWPGRRWMGLDGAAEAMRACEAVQLDPLNVVARSHEIVLWSRVLDYRQGYFERLLYQDRKFFEYGGALFAYPMAELPYWSKHMRYWAQNGRWAAFLNEHPALADEVRAAIRERGPLGNRDFAGSKRFAKNYRGSKDTSLVLYALWISGELMVHHRERFEKLFDFRENIVPAEYLRTASPVEAEQYFARKTLFYLGLARERGFAWSVGDFLMEKIDKTASMAWLDRLVEEGAAIPVQVEGEKEVKYAPGEDAAIIDAIESGRVPEHWQSSNPTTEEEVVFLAPLDIVSARGRAKKLFDFDYVWEVYKPAETRRWGYYTIPILYGDRLVGRLDPALDRAAAVLRINGFWLEDHFDPAKGDFSSALGRGLLRFAQFTGAKQVEVQAIQPDALRTAVEEQITGGDISIASPV